MVRLAFIRFQPYVIVCECTLFSILHMLLTANRQRPKFWAQNSRALREYGTLHVHVSFNHRETDSREDTGLQFRKNGTRSLQPNDCGHRDKNSQQHAKAQEHSCQRTLSRINLCRGCRILGEIVGDSAHLWRRISSENPAIKSNYGLKLSHTFTTDCSGEQGRERSGRRKGGMPARGPRLGGPAGRLCTP